MRVDEEARGMVETQREVRGRVRRVRDRLVRIQKRIHCRRLRSATLPAMRLRACTLSSTTVYGGARVGTVVRIRMEDHYPYASAGGFCCMRKAKRFTKS